MNLDFRGETVPEAKGVAQRQRVTTVLKVMRQTLADPGTPWVLVKQMD